MNAFLYPTVIRHVRRSPLRNEFTYRSYTWLVDLDDLPVLPVWLAPFARFLPQDHLGDPDRTIRQNIAEFLRSEGRHDDGGRVTMLAGGRVLGRVFNPLSLFWCHDRSGALTAVVAEVHNTYGERHCYLLDVDDRGTARAEKRLYVSPFNAVEGEYEMRVPEPGEKLGVAVVLHRDTHAPFTATMTGRRLPATTATITKMALAVPVAPLRVVVQIRWQGIRLWLRRLPVSPRPRHQHQEAVR